MTYDYHRLCSVCAWRAACLKKFSLSQDSVHCPDFSKDVTIKESPEKKEENTEVKEKK